MHNKFRYKNFENSKETKSSIIKYNINNKNAFLMHIYSFLKRSCFCFHFKNMFVIILVFSNHHMCTPGDRWEKFRVYVIKSQGTTPLFMIRSFVLFPGRKRSFVFWIPSLLLISPTPSRKYSLYLTLSTITRSVKLVVRVTTKRCKHVWKCI